MINNWKYILLLCISIGNANNFDHERMLLEYLFSFSAESKYQEMIDMRIKNEIDKAKEFMDIQNIIKNNVNLDINSYEIHFFVYDSYENGLLRKAPYFYTGSKEDLYFKFSFLYNSNSGCGILYIPLNMFGFP